MFAAQTFERHRQLRIIGHGVKPLANFYFVRLDQIGTRKGAKRFVFRIDYHRNIDLFGGSNQQLRFHNCAFLVVLQHQRLDARACIRFCSSQNRGEPIVQIARSLSRHTLFKICTQHLLLLRNHSHLFDGGKVFCNNKLARHAGSPERAFKACRRRIIAHYAHQGAARTKCCHI